LATLAPEAKIETPPAVEIAQPVVTSSAGSSVEAPSMAPPKDETLVQDVTSDSSSSASTAGAAKPVARVAKAAEPKPAAPVKPSAHRTGFKANEFIVYPAHGVGQIVQIEEQEVAGFKLELFVISFAKDKMTLKVPLPKVVNGAIRKLSDPNLVKRSLDTVMGRARVKRTMWSRRAQEYEAKINSGDLIAIAEVVRDLYRSEAQPEQSYSERQLYEAALDRMAREIAAVQKLTETESLKLIESQLQKGPKRGAKNETLPDSEGAEADPDIEEAA
jgi:CarD family transcriptional regulator